MKGLKGNVRKEEESVHGYRSKLKRKRKISENNRIHLKACESVCVRVCARERERERPLFPYGSTDLRISPSVPYSKVMTSPSLFSVCTI